MNKTSSKDLERKLKTEHVEVCLNCKLFTGCEDIGMLEECEDSLEVEGEKMMVIVSLNEYAKLDRLRINCLNNEKARG